MRSPRAAPSLSTDIVQNFGPIDAVAEGDVLEGASGPPVRGAARRYPQYHGGTNLQSPTGSPPGDPRRHRFADLYITTRQLQSPTGSRRCGAPTGSSPSTRAASSRMAAMKI